MSNNRLAWHETLELHELVAFQSNGLIMLKKTIKEVKDPALVKLYKECTKAIESNLKELIAFFPQTPALHHRQAKDPETGYFSGSLLGMAKTMVRNYAIAITETATPQLRQVLNKQLNTAVQLHASVFYFMYERSYYPSYNLEELLKNDLQNAKTALSL